MAMTIMMGGRGVVRGGRSIIALLCTARARVYLFEGDD